MSSWIDETNKQEKAQKTENLMNRLQEIRFKEDDKITNGSGDRPPMGGIGRGKMNKASSENAANFSGFSVALGDSKTSNSANFSGGFGSNGSGFGNSSFGSSSANNKTTFGNVSTPPSSEVKDDEFDRPQTKEEESHLNKILHDKLVEIKSTVKIERTNPNSPLYSIKSFEELRLRDELLKGVSAMGFSFPSKIQEAALPMILADPPQSLIAQSQSGTGKTAAFVLCMLSRVDPSKAYPQCICLAPTYELALQIGKVIETMGQFCKDIRVAYAVRNNKIGRRNQRIQEQIIIGTPGTTLDWVIKLNYFDPKEIRVFVLDEADVMISQQGHQDQSVRINKEFQPECQRLLFSATYDADVMEFADKILTDAILITLRREELPLDNIRQYYVDCTSQEDKFRSLCNLYGSLTIGQSMIFCHTKKTASWLAGQMAQAGHAVSMISSDLEIDQRADVIRRFRNGQERVLISTNVCARGIDVEQVTVVVNFDMPITVDRRPDFDTYLHRIGRTGRFGKAGLAINYVDGGRSRQILREIEEYFGKKIQKLDTEDVDVLEKIENPDKADV